jgi:plasmid stabilization system protein ParE
MNEFAFHPEADVDLIEIWDFIAEDSVDAADRVRDDIFATIRRLVRTPQPSRRGVQAKEEVSYCAMGGNRYSVMAKIT